MLALIMESSEIASQVILKCLDDGLLLFWLLYEGRAIRISPPLNIAQKAIEKGFNQLICIGGDGTIHHMINGIMKQNFIQSNQITSYGEH